MWTVFHDLELKWNVNPWNAKNSFRTSCLCLKLQIVGCECISQPLTTFVDTTPPPMTLKKVKVSARPKSYFVDIRFPWASKLWVENVASSNNSNMLLSKSSFDKSFSNSNLQIQVLWGSSLVQIHISKFEQNWVSSGKICRVFEFWVACSSTSKSGTQNQWLMTWLCVRQADGNFQKT